MTSTYECRVDKYFEDGSPLVSNHIARTPAAARYKFYQQRDSSHSYSHWFKHIKSRSLGKVSPNYFFGNAEKFEDICKRRGIDKARMGMRITVGGKEGVIVAGNDSLNLDVLFQNGQIHNCHPHYETVYYEGDTIVYDFINKNTK